MAAEPAFPAGFTSTGTAWKTRVGALVHRVRGNHGRETFFCTGCLHFGTPSPNFQERIPAQAQQHADGCTGVQV